MAMNRNAATFQMYFQINFKAFMGYRNKRQLKIVINIVYIANSGHPKKKKGSGARTTFHRTRFYTGTCDGYEKSKAVLNVHFPAVASPVVTKSRSDTTNAILRP